MQDFIAAYSHRLREDYPDAVAIILKGSHARSEASSWSDIDFDVLVSTTEIEEYRTWIELVGERLVHVSAAVESLEAWLADASEPSSWSYGLPTHETTRLLWAATSDLYSQLDRPYKPHPAAEPEVEDAIEGLGKIRNALTRSDECGVYQAAQVVGKLIPTLLIPLNPPVYTSHAADALRLILAFPHVPEHFAEDWLTCLGLVRTRTPESTARAAERLIRNTVTMLPADPDVVGNDIAGLLADGSLLAYIQQGD